MTYSLVTGLMQSEAAYRRDRIVRDWRRANVRPRPATTPTPPVARTRVAAATR